MPFYPDSSSAINLAARQIYADIRRANSGAKNYDPTDVIMYIYSVIEMYELVADLIRVYRIANTYDGLNRNLGDKLVIACGYNPLDIRANLPQLRFNIVQIILKLRTLFIPKGFTILDRRL